MEEPVLVRQAIAEPAPRAVGWHRWGVCGLLFLATTINYVDRQVIGVLKPTLQEQVGLSEIDYGHIVFTFQLAYAIGYLAVGRLMDRIGVRRGFALAVTVWSLAAMAHGLVGLIPANAQLTVARPSGPDYAGIALGAAALSAIGLAAARFALGLAEGGNFPGAVKAVGQWFPKRERALATGLFNSGSNAGAVITPLAVPLLTVKFGWAVAFYATGALGFLWLFAWLRLYHNPEDHPRLSEDELAYIRSDPPDPPARIGWLSLLKYRQTWAFTVAMFLVAPVWWFYLYWIPGFLHDRHGLNLLELGPPLVAIYLMADVGSIGGGWLSSRWIKRGWSVNAARKTAMLLCALCVVPVFAAPLVAGVWTAVAVIGLAAAAHQGFAANLYTLVSDTVPRKAVSSVVGIGGMAGSIGGMLIAELAGYVLEWTGHYMVLFAIAASAYLVAMLAIQLLLPRLEPMALASLDEQDR